MTGGFSWRRALAIAHKEALHIVRDPYTLAMSLGMPIFMVVMYGLAIDFNVKHIKLAVNDQDSSFASRQLVETFNSSDYFEALPVEAVSTAQELLASETVRAGLLIPPGFASALYAQRGAQMQILLDGADSSTVGAVGGYLGMIQARAIRQLGAGTAPEPVALKSRLLFNPELNSRWFIVPGLTVVVMAILSILLTSLTVSREWENGSMELLLSTPVRPSEIIFGKLAPYGVLGLVAVAGLMVIAPTVFGVPFVGSLGVFGLGCLLFLATYLAQGLLISVMARNQMVAMQVAMMTGFLPSQLLSGFIFPIASMPEFFRYFTMVFPARWFMQISRDSYLKGSTLAQLAVPLFAISVIGCLIMLRARSKFRGDLE